MIRLAALCLLFACGDDPKQAGSERDCELATWYRDADFDGYGDEDQPVEDCAGAAPEGYTDVVGDCDDANVSVHPDAAEACNGLDDDCDGAVDAGAADAPLWHPDADGDGFGDAESSENACAAPPGFVYDGTDCDDRDPDTWPGAPEVCDGADQDCDGVVDNPELLPSEPYWLDGDGDGYGDPATETWSCSPLSGYVLNGVDCDDEEPTTHPNAEEICEDGVDNDCELGDDLCIYLFSGVAVNLDVAELVGWTECYSTTYNTTVPISTITAACTGTHMLLACRQTGSTVLTAAAYAPVADVTYDTGTGNTLHNANGVGWYYNSSYSWGFVREGDSVSRNSCDTGTGVAPTERLCWHTSGGSLSGGYRCGSTTSLNSSTAWERVVFSGDAP